MKLVRIDREGKVVWGALEGDEVLTLDKAPYEELSFDGGRLPLAECRLLAPCEPTKIICVGKNYYDHAVEMGGGRARPAHSLHQGAQHGQPP